jgi:hypothetical protein
VAFDRADAPKPAGQFTLSFMVNRCIDAAVIGGLGTGFWDLQELAGTYTSRA